MATSDFSSIADSIGNFLGDYGGALGVGAQGIGTYLRAEANRKIRAEQNRRMQEEAARQRAYQDQIDQRLAAATAKFTPASQEADRQAIADKYRRYIAPAPIQAADVGEFIPGAAGAPKEVQDRAAAQLADAKEKAAEYASGLANLNSYSGLDTNRKIALGDANRDVGRVLDFSRGSEAILPYSLFGAQRAGSDLNTASDIANGVGSIAFLFDAMKPKKVKDQKPAAGSGLTMGSSGAGLRPSGGNLGLRLY